MKKLLAICLAVVMMLGLAACGSTGSSTPAPADSASAAPTGQDDAVDAPPADGVDTAAAADFRIGIIQLTEHPALDAARDGFIDALVAAGFSKDNIDVQNAQGEIPNCSTIATKFVNDKVDLILAIATPAAQTAAQATTEIPILATAVTDFVEAGLVDSNEVPGGNISGTSDMNPISEQADLLVKLVPEAKTVGILYCSAEDNSILQARLARAALEALGLTVNEYQVADVNEIQPVTTKAVGEVDAIYIPTDNLFADNMPTAALVTEPAKIPVICGESGMVNSGGTATYGINYYNLGKLAGEQAVEILLNGKDISTMPIGFAAAEDLEFAVNEENCAAIGIEIPADLMG